MGDHSELVPMRVVERLTGIPSDTIRVWERRYSAVTPKRTEGNARRYVPDDIKRLKMLRELCNLGHSIGDIARLPAEQLLALRDALPRSSDRAQRQQDAIDRYLDRVMKVQVRDAYSDLTRLAALTPAVTFALNFIAPLLRRVGEMWCAGELQIAHERIITGQLRNLLGAMIGQTEPPAGAPKIVVATPPDHQHEFGALIGAFIAASRGVEPIYLGSDVPWDQLIMVSNDAGAKAVLLGLSRSLSDIERTETIQNLTRLGESTELWLGLSNEHELATVALPAQVFSRFEHLDAALLALAI